MNKSIKYQTKKFIKNISVHKNYKTIKSKKLLKSNINLKEKQDKINWLELTKELKCIKHENLAETYCINHNILCCIECIVNDKHQFDDILNINESIDYIKNDLSTMYENSKTKINDIRWLIEEKVKNKELKIKELNDKKEELKMNILKIINNIKLSENNYIEDLEEKERAINGNFILNINDWNKNLNKWIKFNKDYDNIIEKGKNELVNFYIKIKNFLNLNNFNEKDNINKFVIDNFDYNNLINDLNKIVPNKCEKNVRFCSPKRFTSYKKINQPKKKEINNINHNINFFQNKLIKSIDTLNINKINLEKIDKTELYKNWKYKMLIKDIKCEKIYKFNSIKNKIIQIKSKIDFSKNNSIFYKNKLKLYDKLKEYLTDLNINEIDIYCYKNIIYFINKYTFSFKYWDTNNNKINDIILDHDILFEKIKSKFLNINNKLYLIFFIKNFKLFQKIYIFDFETNKINFLLNIEPKKKLKFFNVNENIFLCGDIKDSKFGYSIICYNIFDKSNILIMKNNLKPSECFVDLFKDYLIIFEGGKYQKNKIKVIDFINKTFNEFISNLYLEEFKIKIKGFSKK